jgi:hypothetical protein
MKKILALLLAVLIAGCASIVKVEGEQLVNSRMSVQLPTAWNRIAINNQPYELWTQDGVSLDQLRMWAAVAPGQALIRVPNTPSGQKAPRVPTYAANMTPDQIVNLFEIMYAVDGSQVRITRVEPGTFAGEKGVRFEFAVTRKSNDLQLHGVGWAAIRNNELYAATFIAPELSFFKRLLPQAEGVVASAKIKS